MQSVYWTEYENVFLRRFWKICTIYNVYDVRLWRAAVSEDVSISPRLRQRQRERIPQDAIVPTGIYNRFNDTRLKQYVPVCRHMWIVEWYFST